MRKNRKLPYVPESVRTEYGFSFAKNTAYGCGGNAKVAYFPAGARQLAAVYDFLLFNEIKFVTLGNGTNVLASDRDFDGAVISTIDLKGIYRTGANTLFCRAGTKVAALLKYCAGNGFGGLEYLAGIPATCGGLVLMNGGAGGKYVGENTVGVKIYDGKFRRLSNKSCRFGQKYSVMRDKDCVIFGAELSFTPDSPENIRAKIAERLAARAGQPSGRNCGCVFKNAGGTSAGRIIDEAGLKGLSVGGAFVSEKHANFIINTGTSSSDVFALIKEVKRAVSEKTGIVLEEEVVYIGDFNDSFG